VLDESNDERITADVVRARDEDDYAIVALRTYDGTPCYPIRLYANSLDPSVRVQLPNLDGSLRKLLPLSAVDEDASQ